MKNEAIINGIEMMKKTYAGKELHKGGRSSDGTLSLEIW